MNLTEHLLEECEVRGVKLTSRDRIVKLDSNENVHISGIFSTGELYLLAEMLNSLGIGHPSVIKTRRKK